MTFEALTIAAAGPAGSGAAAPVGAAIQPMEVGYNVSLSDVGGFQQALSSAGMRLETRPVSPGSAGLQSVFEPLESVNNEAARLSEIASAAESGDQPMSPGQVVALTVRSTEFMFHSQLIANIANRTSDGLQQLFRQQS